MELPALDPARGPTLPDSRPSVDVSYTENLPEPAMKWQAQHLLHGSRLFERRCTMSAPRRRADHLPVGCAITGPAKPCGIYERLQPINRMCVEPLPVLRNQLRHTAQKVRG